MHPTPSRRPDPRPVRALVALSLALTLLLVLSACGSDDASDTTADPTAVPSSAPSSIPTGIGTGDTTTSPPPTSDEPIDPNPDCDPLAPFECAMPWPSNLYLEDDASRTTGHTLAFGPTTLPANWQGTHVDPSAWRRMDGYGVSTPLLVHFPNLDVSDMPTEYTVAMSIEDDAPILLYRVGEDGSLDRIPYWVDLDDWDANPARKTLYIRPGVLLEPNTRYLAALRDLRDTDGNPQPRSAAFDRLVRGDTAEIPTLANRQDRFNDIFDLLEGEGVPRDSLTLAWDFVTASSDTLHGPMLHMRRDGLDRTGTQGPEIVLGEPEVTPDDEHEHWAWVLRGHIEVPDYMVQDSRPGPPIADPPRGYIFHLGEDGMPTPSGTREAPFYIGIPHSAIDGPPHGLVQYGHGFFGTARGAIGGWTHNGQLANEHNVIFFGGFLTGMAEFDLAGVEAMIFDFTYFTWLSDRVHQGLLEWILLARAMKERFGDLEPIVEQNVSIDTDRMFYLGISQGGIYGATYMALAPDIERGHLGVPGQNYSLMEHRSTNFDQFFLGIGLAYPGRAAQAVLLSAAQTLWDQTDPGSYWRHITAEPFEDGPPRFVIAAPSRGDLQVSTVTMEVVARSNIGVATMENYDAERDIDLVDKTPYPHTGSAIVLYDFGFEWPEGGLNRPPSFNRDDVDAHNAPRRNTAHNEQMFHFFETGEVIDTCGGAPCSFPPSAQ